tara:strand:- start:2800 stop:4446 length:1647 start_codon:yes stop_codon:yes gene_type:complete
MSDYEHYLGNPLLKKSNVPVEWDKEQILEYQKCMEDPLHFIQNYIRIVSLDEGLVPFTMFPFQKDMVGTIHNNRFTICRMPRQSGKSTTMVSYILHYVLFNPSMNVAILANKASTARDILGRLQLAYENLPKWLQQGVMSWNKGSLELENGSKIVASSTSSSAVRGGSFNMIFLDEFAFVPTNVASDFFSSVYPTISSGTSTKVIIVSTPNGMNLFYKLWTDAENKRNSYNIIDVHWSEVPGRDDKWREETIANTSEEQFQREFECEFLGSSNTLIHPSKIKTMAFQNPIESNAGLDMYERPNPLNTYVLIADVSRGTNNDYSAFIVFDVSTVPYKICAKYRNNEIKPMLFPNIIHDVAKAYNQAYVMVEVNDIGEQVASSLQFDLEYENLIMASMRGRAGQVVGGGFSGGKAQLGVRTTKAVKKMGCSNIKQIIETDKLIINDYNLINEWSTFILKGQSYEAEEGHCDDLAMCCVLFGWLVQQTYFKELTDDDIRARMFAEQQGQLEQDMAPFGFLDNGIDDPMGETIVDEYGTRWSPVVRTHDTSW